MRESGAWFFLDKEIHQKSLKNLDWNTCVRKHCDKFVIFSHYLLKYKQPVTEAVFPELFNSQRQTEALWTQNCTPLLSREQLNSQTVNVKHSQISSFTLVTRQRNWFYQQSVKAERENKESLTRWRERGRETELSGAAAACFHSDAMQGRSTERERQRERMKPREKLRRGHLKRDRRAGQSQVCTVWM